MERVQQYVRIALKWVFQNRPRETHRQEQALALQALKQLIGPLDRAVYSQEQEVLTLQALKEIISLLN